MKIINKKQILAIALSVLVSVAAVATIVYATTSIGDDISVGSTLTVTATSTLNGNVILGNAAADVLTVYAPLVWAATSTAYGIDLNSATTTSADIRLSNGETIDNMTDGIIQVLGGSLKSGSSTVGVTTAGGSTMIYGLGVQKTNALTSDLIGVRGDARLNVDSASGLVMGGYFMAVNGPEGGTGYTVDTMRGIYIDTFTKAPAASTMTITNARGAEINLGLSAASSTVTNAYGIYLNVTTDKNTTQNGFTTGYGLWIQNEGVGGYGGAGTGQMLTAGIYLKGLNQSGGVKAFDYGIDMSAATIGTADIRLSSSALIFTGSAANGDAVYAEVGAKDATGSLYITTAGKLYVQVANTGAATDWQLVTTSDVD